MTAARKQKRDAPHLKLVKAPRMTKFGKRHHKLLKILWEQSLTDEELTLKTGLSPSYSRLLREDLVQFGYVKSSNATRRTIRGWNATVWQLTKEGMKKAKEIENEV